MSSPSPTLNLKLHLARCVRNNKPQSEIDSARRDFYAESLAEHIEKTVAKAPKLTAAQLDRLNVLLRGGK